MLELKITGSSVADLVAGLQATLNSLRSTPSIAPESPQTAPAVEVAPTPSPAPSKAAAGKPAPKPKGQKAAQAKAAASAGSAAASASPAPAALPDRATVESAFRAYIASAGPTSARAILTKFGINRMTELPDEKLGEFAAAIA